MKTVFWFVGLFAVAVALALLMGQNSATVTLFWLPYRVDMSFNLALAVLLLVFVLAYFSLRSMAALRSLPRRAAQWRLTRRERTLKAALLDALSHQMAGRFVRARSATREALDHLDVDASPGDDEGMPGQSRWRAMAHLLAAEAAHSLRDHMGRDREFALALAAAARGSDGGVVRDGALLRAIRWAVEDRDLEAATHWLAQLPQGASRRTLALRLKLRVARLAQDHTTALDTARLLAKHGAFSAPASRSLLRGLFLDGLRACHDTDQVSRLWRGTDARDRQDPELVLAAVKRLRQLVSVDPPSLFNGPGQGGAGFSPAPDSEVDSAAGAGVAADVRGSDESRALAMGREWLAPVWDSYPALGPNQQEQLVRVMQSMVSGVEVTWLARIERMQRRYPADPLLQYLAGDVFFRQQLWGKAQALLGQAARGLQSEALRVHAWVRLAELAEQRGDAPAALAAWREAAIHRIPSPEDAP